MNKKILLLFAFIFYLTINSLAKTGDKFTLVIDPGHGGHDAGALGTFSKEKDINLNVSLAFGKYVEQYMKDVNVIYTRKTDVFIPLHTRADIANKAKADLFISIHTNSVVPGHYAKGFQVYTLGMHRAKDNLDVAMRENSVISMESDYKQTYEGFNPNSSESYIMFEFMQNANMEKSVELARLIQSNVCSTAGRIDKGVHQAGFLVLRESSMPSCLIELGFITAPDEEEFLNSQAGINAMANGIYRAFVSYKNMYNNHLVAPYRGPDNPRISVGRAVPTPVVSSASIQSLKFTPKKSKIIRKIEKTEKTLPASPNIADAPIFKVQIFATSMILPINNFQLKGHKEAEYYKDNNWYKYTIGSSQNYNEMRKLREKLLKDFPQAYIVAFKKGVKMNINTAIDEFLKNKRR